MKRVDPIEVTEATEQMIHEWNEMAQPLLRLTENWWFPIAYMAAIILWMSVWAWMV
jgi:hypothetical protein